MRKASRENNIPQKVVINKSGSNKSALNAINTALDQGCSMQLFQSKYLNNMIEQDDRFIKKGIKPMLGFKSFHAASITISGIGNIRMVQKGQINQAKKQVAILSILLE